MGAKVNIDDGFVVSWDAPVVPSVSLAGIPLKTSAQRLREVLLRSAVDDGLSVFQFDRGPRLRLESYSLDEYGNGGYAFFLLDREIINKSKALIPALSIMIREYKVYALKIYDFSFPGERCREYIYRGKLPQAIGLGDRVAVLSQFTKLEFDEAEGWFYTDVDYGGLEVTGLGVPLEDYPDQKINALCVISKSPCCD